MAAPRQASSPRPLPSGRHDLPRAVVSASQLERLLEGMIDTVAEKGYAKTVISDVHQRAGVSKKTFYEHFASKEECFLAAYDASVDLVLGAIDEAIRSHPEDPVAAASAASVAYVETLADHPKLARTFLVEVLAAGPPTLIRRRTVLRRFADQIAVLHGMARERWPEVEELPEHRCLAAVGAVNEIVTDLLLHEEPEALRALAPIVLDIMVGLLIGHETLARLTGEPPPAVAAD